MKSLPNKETLLKIIVMVSSVGCCSIQLQAKSVLWYKVSYPGLEKLACVEFINKSEQPIRLKNS